MPEYTVYLIQCRNSEGYWVDYSRDQMDTVGLFDRARTLSGSSCAKNPYLNQFRVIKRTISEEVLSAPETS